MGLVALQTHSRQRKHSTSQESGTFQADLILAGEYPVLARYMGDIRFKSAGLAFMAADGSHNNQRSLVGAFPRFLAHSDPFSRYPELGELAEFELCFLLALEADDQGFESIATPEMAEGKTLSLHPSVKTLAFRQNTTSLWSALQCGETPPRPFRLDRVQHVVVWRQGAAARFRMLGEPEAAALASFNSKAARALPYFATWLEAGLVVAVVK